MRNRPVAVAWAPTDRILDVGVALLLVGGLLLPFAATRAATGDPVLLNEMLVSHIGADSAEYVELYGTPGHSLAGLSLVVVEGDNSAAGTIDLRVDFAADDRLGGNGFFLVGNPAGLGSFYGVVPDVPLSPVSPAVELLENGSQTIALVVTSSVGAVGTQVTGNEVVRDVVGLQDPGFSETFFWGAPVFGPIEGFLPSGARRATDGLDTDTAADWLEADHDLGAANTPTSATPWVDPGPPPGDEPSFEALADLLDELVASGSVHPAKAAVLASHLDRATSLAAQSRNAAALAQLRAFVNQAHGLTPRWLTPAAADELADLAEALAANLGD